MAEPSTEFPEKVLLVEDSKFVVDSVSMYLRRDLMVEFVVARSFADAREILAGHSKDFFVAILDLNLPDATEGEVVDYVIGKGVPPIILTASYQESIRQEMSEKPIIDYVIKRNHLELEYLISIVRRVKENVGRRVMVVDDSASCRMILSRSLARQHLRVIEAESAEKALELMEEYPNITLIVTDQNMPGMSGCEMVAKIREKKSRSELAIIGISSSQNSELTSKFLKSGANDFFVKPFSYEELFCRVAQNIDLVSNCKKLSESSDYDTLTKVHSRKYLMNVGKVLNGNSRRSNITMVVSIIKLNEFHHLNDEHGPHVGDQSLVHVAETLQNTFRQTDIVGRVGGAEFCVICVDIREDAIDKIFNRVRSSISSSTFEVDGEAYGVTVSVGYCNNCNKEFDERIKRARQYLKRLQKSF